MLSGLLIMMNMKLLLEVQQECLERLDIWLTKKGVIEYHNKFTFFIDTYLAYIYAYVHEESVTLKSGPGKYFVEFMMDHLLRKDIIRALGIYIGSDGNDAFLHIPIRNEISD